MKKLFTVLDSTTQAYEKVELECYVIEIMSIEKPDSSAANCCDVERMLLAKR